MAVSHKQLLLLFLFSLLLTVHARLHLNPSDLRAISAVRRNLGFNSHHLSSVVSPCNLPGVFCHRRLSELRVTKLVFNSQSLSGTLSSEIGRLSELKELSLRNNRLVDRVPHELVNCRKLEILDLANNQFSGDVVSSLGKLVRLRFLNLSSNSFCGDLSFLQHFPNLETLSLSNNFFTGQIPDSIRSFRNLRSFDFSGNRLTRFESSEYPNRYIFAEENGNESVSGPTSSAAAPEPSSSSPRVLNIQDVKEETKKKQKLADWLLGFLAGAMAGSISGFVFCVMFRLILAAVRGGGKDSGPAIFSPVIKNPADLAFLEKEDVVATLEIIGKGGCGEVYKAELPGSNGKMIAIKKIVQNPKDFSELSSEKDSKIVVNKKMRQIESEINTVSQIRHRNLLPLLAHVTGPNCHYLIYEFMNNGSLQNMLVDASKGKTDLDWPARYKIAVGIAAGLEYLHIHHSPRIIHRDLKPGNVLLDDDMEPRITDFGLAKSMPDANTHITSSNVAGTVGYIAPEYHQTLKFTDKCDIYSFGVLLGVMLIGKLPSDEFFQHTREMSLVKWMKNVMTSDDPGKAIDPKLLGKGYDEQILLVLKIACFCTIEDPKQRPNSKDVRAMLAQIKH
ncbi:Leucine-rich repeat receptor-like serine/threonine/tyrosine-protein kinase SOBIR1 [Linum perenne]